MTEKTQVVDEKKKSNFELSVDTQAIVKMLQAAKIGETIEYPAMNTTLGRNVQREARGNLSSSRRILLNDESKVFGTVSGIGVRLLGNHEISSLGTGAIRHIGNTARRTSRKMLCAEYDKLDNGDRVTMNAQLSVLGALSQATKPKTMKAVEAKVSEVNDRLPLAKTLELFS